VENLDQTLTPKRKSIIWNYIEDEKVLVVVLKSQIESKLTKFFKGESFNCEVNEEDAIGVIINPVAVLIWENCDGLTTISEIIDIILNEYDVERSKVEKDVNEFLISASTIGMLDIKWRCII
jgi:hypothetical protein